VKHRISCLIALFLALVLPMAAQDTGGVDHIQPNRIIVLNNTTLTLNGPPGPASVLQVTGGNSTGTLQAGSGLQFTSGDGAPVVGPFHAGAGGLIQLSGGSGGLSCNFPGCAIPGGTGGDIMLTAGKGGDRQEGGDGQAGTGGWITLQPGPPGFGFGGAFGGIALAPMGGLVGVGTDSPTNTLEVAAGGTTLADSWTVRSSRRFKTNIQPLIGAVQKIAQLQGVSYERKSDGKREIGVIAEDVDLIVPEIVSRDPKTNEVQGLDYARLTALLVEAVKSQQVEIQQLKTRVDQLMQRQ